MTWCGDPAGPGQAVRGYQRHPHSPGVKLARSGLGDLFDGVFISEVVGAEKPSLDFFRPVLEAIGPYDREELLLIGDSLTSDMGGRQPGGYPLLLVQPQGPAPPGPPCVRYEVRNLNQVREIVAGKC